MEAVANGTCRLRRIPRLGVAVGYCFACLLLGFSTLFGNCRPALAAPNSVAVLGDSAAEQLGPTVRCSASVMIPAYECPDGTGFVEVLSRILGLHEPTAFQNLAAKPARTIEVGLEQVPMLSRAANIVVLYTGLNDASRIANRQERIAQWSSDYRWLVDRIRLRAPAARIFLVTVPVLENGVDAVNAMNRFILSQAYPTVDVSCGRALFLDSTLTSLSDAGSTAIGEALYEIVRAWPSRTRIKVCAPAAQRLPSTYGVASDVSRRALHSHVTTVSSGPAVPALFGSPVVGVSLTWNGASFGTGVPFGPGATFASQVEKSGFDPTVDTNRIFLGSGDSVLQYVSGGAYTGVALPLPRQARGPIISGLATLNLNDDPHRQMIYVSDMASTDLRVVAFDSDPFTGITSNAASRGINVVSLRQGTLSHVLGPALGIASIGPRQGAKSSMGTLFVATPSAIYALDLAEDGTGARFRVDRIRRIASHRFGRLPVGLVADRLFERATALYVGDQLSRSLLRVDLQSGAVTTYARLRGAPAGITVDPFSGVVYVAVPATNAVYAVPPSGNPRIAALSVGRLTGMAFDPQGASIVGVDPERNGILMFIR